MDLISRAQGLWSGFEIKDIVFQDLGRGAHDFGFKH
jgi:hypothetical protein